MSITKGNLSYKDSGVDIDAGNKLVDIIKPFAKSTSRLGSNPSLGGFGALFDIKKCNYRDPVLVSCTDGVGTKLKIAIETNNHSEIGIDLVAMSVNDLIVQGAEPLFFLDYFACSKLDIKIASSVIEGIANGCKQANCALIGGETAEMPGMYQEGDYDLAGFAVGMVERELILPKETSEGDILIGLSSSGIHSNGYSLVRYILEKNSLNFESEFCGAPIYKTLLTPTKIYVNSCLKLAKASKIKAMAHITGGGLVENLPRVLNKGLIADINYNSWERPEIFKFLQKIGNVGEEEMRKTFNCGIGMVLVVSPENVDFILNSLKEDNQQAFIIGKFVKL
jgi:phosphoribosylformylglycinamidine cyclo-ligase